MFADYSRQAEDILGLAPDKSPWTPRSIFAGGGMGAPITAVVAWPLFLLSTNTSLYCSAFPPHPFPLVLLSFTLVPLSGRTRTSLFLQ